MSTALADLLPEAQDAATRAIEDLKRRGIPFAITATLRTAAEQRALYAQGRESIIAVNARRITAGLNPLPERENHYTVTNCDGTKVSEGGHGRSPHQLGKALDVVPLGPRGPEWPPASDPRWQDIAPSFKAQGFAWGGDWKDFLDLPHYQLA